MGDMVNYLSLLNRNETIYFSRNVSKEEYKINHYFNYNEKCLIYLFICKLFLKQYIGQTVNQFRLRWNNCKSNRKKYRQLEKCIQAYKNIFLNILMRKCITISWKTSPSHSLIKQTLWNFWKEKTVTHYLAVLTRPLKIKT